MKSIRAVIAGALALSLLAVGAASAQTAPAPGGAPMQPSDTKQYGDWVVRCFPVASPSPCDMFELLANKQSNQRILSISIAYLPQGDKHVMQIAVPLGVLIQKGLVIIQDGQALPAIRYRRCDRGGCYVEMLVDNQMINALGASTGPAKIRIVAEGGKAFDIPFSLNGFNDAHGAMTDLARKKINKPADATAPAPDATPPAAPAPDATAPAPDPTTPPTP